ncbi:MAG: substrate-binding domain-containing protein [Propioniciclava sp.]
MEFAAGKYDAEVIVIDAKSSQQTQVSGSSDLINQGVSVLVVSPVQPDALPVTVDEAHAAGVPIIIGDVGAAGNYDAYILSDNFDGGSKPESTWPIGLRGPTSSSGF